MEPRKLTESEIQDIVGSLRIRTVVNSRDLARVIDAYHARMRKFYAKQLASVCIYPDQIPALKEEMQRQIESSQIDAGKSVGVIASQSIGERQTQLTLNTFHRAGSTVATVVAGVPRFRELMDATKNPKVTTTFIRFKSQIDNILECSKMTRHLIMGATLGDISVGYSVHRRRQKPWYEAWRLLSAHDTTEPDDSLDTVVRVDLDVDKMYMHRLTPFKVAQTVSHATGFACISSPVHQARIEVFGDIKRSILDDILLCGVRGISNVRYAVDKQGMLALADGSNLVDVLTSPFVKFDQTYSDSMWEMYEVLGIEAAREFLVSEFMRVISMDSFMNPCHVQLLVDVITFSGTITPISRFGVQRAQSGPLSKASFENMLENLLLAASYGERDSTRGVSASIICGKPARMGSGLCDLVHVSDMSELEARSVGN